MKKAVTKATWHFLVTRCPAVSWLHLGVQWGGGHLWWLQVVLGEGPARGGWLLPSVGSVGSRVVLPTSAWGSAACGPQLRVWWLFSWWKEVGHFDGHAS